MSSQKFGLETLKHNCLQNELQRFEEISLIKENKQISEDQVLG
jgi:hypothetical protein